jgi:universal stress protein A
MQPTIRTILVPTDFSDLSVEAIRYAMSLAGLYQADLHLLHVVDDAPVLAFHTMEMTTDYIIEDTTRTAEQHLQDFARLHDVHGRQGVTLAVRRGNPHDEITRYAADEHADLIVMATHGRTGLAHVLLGSVAEKVVQHADIPVLTIKPARIKADRSVGQTESEAR